MPHLHERKDAPYPSRASSSSHATRLFPWCIEGPSAAIALLEFGIGLILPSLEDACMSMSVVQAQRFVRNVRKYSTTLNLVILVLFVMLSQAGVMARPLTPKLQEPDAANPSACLRSRVPAPVADASRQAFAVRPSVPQDSVVEGTCRK